MIDGWFFDIVVIAAAVAVVDMARLAAFSEAELAQYGYC